MTEHAGVVRVTTFTTDDDRRARLVEALQRLSEATRGAEGSFGAQVCSVEGHPDAVAAVSRWRSRGDLDRYLSQYGQQVADAVQGLVTSSPTTVHLTSLSPS